MGKFRQYTMTGITNTGLQPRNQSNAARFDKRDEYTCQICRAEEATGLDAVSQLSVCESCAQFNEEDTE
ncbi:hypothetical protein C5B89_18910 [Haloferax sp. Atlit-47N]|nr:hypothetical protein C5B89_18910 [Haloferax sp. Atlit-47N]RDZ34885.1 hypothetical protein C5B88_10655 [Haloferax sp. Atlit-24N]RDZ34891.1 hypothetical protein C5B88_10690 [Haloferax sp. Atlit-24N]RLM35297.1 hypothetical protein DVK03_10665 [Haloferax sp. Atlit-109R]RLM35303.1 hypothetical protein DVK03_10700 [Haloferax sp. Atlit-109R]